jgi:regulator of Ty1 transposition protein 103
MVPFLYLANDILQNSKRNGTEFVEEFWKVLPGALKNVSENGDDRGKQVASRLVSVVYRCHEFPAVAYLF